MNSLLLRYGLHTVAAVLHHHPDSIERLLITSPQVLKKLNPSRSIPVENLSKEALDQRLGHANHQGCAVLMKAHTLTTDLKTLIDQHPEQLRLLTLDGIQDPHNLGACLRCAAAFAIHAILIPKHNSVALTPSAAKVASGTDLLVPVIRTNLNQSIDLLKKAGVWHYGFSEASEHSLKDTPIKPPFNIVMGSEGHGMRLSVHKKCDQILYIPTAEFSTLNVAVATGIALAHTF